MIELMMMLWLGWIEPDQSVATLLDDQSTIAVLDSATVTILD